jgi:sarcosine oxidase
MGSSHGDTRITRQAIGEGREFVPLVLRSDEIWKQLESATGLRLVTRNGGLVMASPGIPGSHHGSSSFVQDTIDTATEFGIAHQTLDASEIQARYPQFRLRGNEVAYFEPGAGFLRPEACISTQLSEAKRLGAEVFPSETVLALKASGTTVNVETDHGTYSAARVIVTAGPWIQQLMGAAYQHLFRVYRQVMNWFAIENNPQNYSPERFPIFIWLTGSEPRDMLYGFPAIHGAEGGIKISTEQYEATVDPDHVTRAVAPSEVDAMFTEYIRPRFRGISSRCLRSETCLYTVTPDAKFIVDQFRGEETILFASACSGHGFKHSAALGEALAMRAMGQAPEVDLSPFRLQRFG